MNVRISFCSTLLVSALLLSPLLGIAQAAPPAKPAKKVLTPDQTAYQQASATWLEQYTALRQQAQAAYVREMAREKAGDCPNANSTRAEEECLTHEMSLTQANLAAVIAALRAMLGLEHSKMPGEQPVSGQTGTPQASQERVEEFDKLEAASGAYRKLAAITARNEFKGGTEVPDFVAEVEQRLTRLHLEELALIYDTEFSNR